MASSAGSAAASAPSSASALPCGIVTMVTSDCFVIGALVLGRSLRRAGGGTRHSLACMVTPSVCSASRQALERGGWRVLPVEPLGLPSSAATHVASWAAVGYTKLRLWQLESLYSRVLYVDADCVVCENLDHLLSDAMSRVTFAAASDTFPPDRFNAGVMLVRPSRRVFDELLRRMSFTPTYDGGDTGFLNAVFDDWHRAPSACSGADAISLSTDLAAVDESSGVESMSLARFRLGMCRLSFGYNALRTMQWMTKKAPAYWQAVRPLLVVHYCSSPKPWEDLTQRRGGFLEQQWFEEHDAMLAEEAAAEAAGQIPVAVEPLEMPIAPMTKLTTSPLQALQRLVEANMDCMPLGEFRSTDETCLNTASAASASTSSTASVDSFAVTSAVATSGGVRPLRSGIWMSEKREQSFIASCQHMLRSCLLSSPPLPSSSSLAASSSNGIPRHVHQIWLGGSMPSEYAEWSTSWQRLHPVSEGWRFTLWTDADLPRFPLCAQLADECPTSARLASHLRELLPRCTSHAQRSDLMRLDILWTVGGLYVDTDFEALASFAPLHAPFADSDGTSSLPQVGARRVGFYTGASNVGVVELNNGLIASVPKHALVAKLIETLVVPALASEDSESTSGAKHSAMQIITSSGPGHFTRTCAQFVAEHSSSDTAAPLDLLFLPAQACYPLPNSMRHLQSSEDKRAFYTEATLAVHHWSCSWQTQATAAQQSKPVEKALSQNPTFSGANLLALAASMQRMQIERAAAAAAASVTTATAASAPAPAPTCVTAAIPATAVAGMNPLLLSKIAGFM